MKIAFGSDHAGFKCRKKIINYLESLGHQVIDFGSDSSSSCDYPLIAAKAAKSISLGRCQRGILMCGTGIGMSIVANKIKGIRAGVCWSDFTAGIISEHNDANIICLGARLTKPSQMLRWINIWLNTPHSKEPRHKRRINQITKLEREWCLAGALKAGGNKK
jgi:ribose 5-phosphate isomerase B